MLEGELRNSIGKGASRALKRDGKLVANIYGKGVSNVHAFFKSNEFIKFMRKKEHLKFPVKVDGKTYEVVVQEYQKHPVTNALTHVDLKVVKNGEISTFMIPVRLEGSPVGLKNKGVLIQSKRRLKVRCDAAVLPDEFVLNVDALDVGDALLVKDVKVPEGVEIQDASRVAVVGVEKA